MTEDAVTRPWGSFQIVYQNPTRTVTVKVINLNPRSRNSLQYHAQRSEIWTGLSGVARVELDGRTSDLAEGQQITIPVKSKHRMGTDRGAQILEVSLGPFDEEDVVRLQDDYNRSNGLRAQP